MKITIDRETCIGAGQCVLSAPTVFDQEEDTGLVILLTESPSKDVLEHVREAAAVCPALAIRLEESA